MIFPDPLQNDAETTAIRLPSTTTCHSNLRSMD